MWTESLQRRRAAPTSRREGQDELSSTFSFLESSPQKPEAHHLSTKTLLSMFLAWHALRPMSELLHRQGRSWTLRATLKRQAYLCKSRMPYVYVRTGRSRCRAKIFETISDNVDAVRICHRHATFSRKPQTWFHAMRTSRSRPEWMDSAHPQQKPVAAIVSTLLAHTMPRQLCMNN